MIPHGTYMYKVLSLCVLKYITHISIYISSIIYIYYSPYNYKRLHYYMCFVTYNVGRQEVCKTSLKVQHTISNVCMPRANIYI